MNYDFEWLVKKLQPFKVGLPITVVNAPAGLPRIATKYIDRIKTVCWGLLIKKAK